MLHLGYVSNLIRTVWSTSLSMPAASVTTDTSTCSARPSAPLIRSDGQVNPVDLGLVQSAFGSADERQLSNYDIDCDNQINPVDAGIMQSLFGACDPPRAACP